MIRMITNLLVVFTFTACYRVENKLNYSEKEKKVIGLNEACKDSLAIQNLLQSVLDISELQQYYPVEEVNDRGYLILLQNKKISKRYNLKKSKKSVVFLSKEEILSNKVTAYLEFIKLDISNEEANVILLYSTQGIRCKATFIKNKCNWELKNSEIIET